VNTFSDPSELRAFVINLADELALAGMPEASERLRVAASTASTTGSEWLGELGLAAREVQREHRPPAKFNNALERVMSTVHVSWPQMRPQTISCIQLSTIYKYRLLARDSRART